MELSTGRFIGAIAGIVRHRTLATMIKSSQSYLDGLAPAGVIASRKLSAAGWSANAIALRCRPGGPWQRILPGVVLLCSTQPTRQQWRYAALTYAQGAVITGLDALAAHGLQCEPTGQIQLLVPAWRRLAPQEGITVERTSRMPAPSLRHGLAFAPLVRAIVDTVRVEQNPQQLLALITAPMRAGLCTVDQLRCELAQGNQRGSAAARKMLQNVTSLRRMSTIDRFERRCA